jgi:hypothetical protein
MSLSNLHSHLGDFAVKEEYLQQQERGFMVVKVQACARCFSLLFYTSGNAESEETFLRK